MNKIKEACGVIGICGPDNINIGELIYFGLIALQHRGQESAGITVSEHSSLKTFKGLGLVREVFKAKDLKSFKGELAIGHTRYATTGKHDLANAQPIVRHLSLGSIAIAHNGNIVNTKILRDQLEMNGVMFETTSDSEVLLALIAQQANNGDVEAINKAISLAQGSFSIVLLNKNKLIGVRDQCGIRPLCLGSIEGGGYVLASESCAIDAVGGRFIRELNPGEVLFIERDPSSAKISVVSYNYTLKAEHNPCAFESIYFSRPDSILNGSDVFQFRKKCGRLLYAQDPVEADVVIGVPDSGVPASLGVAEVSGIPFSLGLVKNKYMGRSFIEPGQVLREKIVTLKLTALRSEVQGKRVLLVDDSLIRGTTSRRIVSILRDAGAKEVYFYSVSPKVISPCFFGIDLPSKADLIAANYSSTAEICQQIGADKLFYLSLDGLKKALGGQKHCLGCFSGEYPLLAHDKIKDVSKTIS